MQCTGSLGCFTCGKRAAYKLYDATQIFVPSCMCITINVSLSSISVCSVFMFHTTGWKCEAYSIMTDGYIYIWDLSVSHHEMCETESESETVKVKNLAYSYTLQLQLHTLHKKPKVYF